jgi:hypothetical protein
MVTFVTPPSDESAATMASPTDTVQCSGILRENRLLVSRYSFKPDEPLAEGILPMHPLETKKSTIQITGIEIRKRRIRPLT